MTEAMESLLEQIRLFCEANKVSLSRFGELALNDKAFVHQLEKGRRVWPETEERVRRFMAGYRAEPREAA